MEAGRGQRQAVAVALSEARRVAPRKRIARRVGPVRSAHDGHVVELNEVVTPELGPWYEAVWRVRGHDRAHRRAEGPKLGLVKKAFERFAREVGATGLSAGGGGGAKSDELTPTMQKAIETIRRWGPWPCGNLGIGRATLDALYARGLIRIEKQIDRKFPGGPMERSFAFLTRKGETGSSGA